MLPSLTLMDWRRMPLHVHTLLVGRKKKSNQSCWGQENGAPVPTPRGALKRGVPATGTWQGHLSFLLVVDTEPQDSSGFVRQGRISL